MSRFSPGARNRHHLKWRSLALHPCFPQSHRGDVPAPPFPVWSVVVGEQVPLGGQDGLMIGSSGGSGLKGPSQNLEGSDDQVCLLQGLLLGCCHWLRSENRSWDLDVSLSEHKDFHLKDLGYVQCLKQNKRDSSVKYCGNVLLSTHSFLVIRG